MKQTPLYLLIGLLSISCAAQEKYSSAECQALSIYLENSLNKKHKNIIESLTKELLPCTSLKGIARKIASYAGNADEEVSLLAAHILVTLDTNLNGAFRRAFLEKRTKTVQYLLEHGVNPDTPIDNALEAHPPDFIPALHYAIIARYPEAAKLVIKHGCDIHTAKNGMTPLMLAAWYGCDDVVKALLSEGASAQVKDANGYTAQDYAYVGTRLLGWSRLNQDTLALLKNH